MPTSSSTSHPSLLYIETPDTDAPFSTRIRSLVDLPPSAVFAEMACPPGTVVSQATYQTLQVGEHTHVSLNSDLEYLNHSCEPTLVRKKNKKGEVLSLGPGPSQPLLTNLLPVMTLGGV